MVHHPLASLSDPLDCDISPLSTRDESPEVIGGGTSLSCETDTDLPGFNYDRLIAVTHSGHFYTSSKILTKRHTSETRASTKGYSDRSSSNVIKHAHRGRYSFTPFEHSSHSLDE
jgi:hypothetical protein